MLSSVEETWVVSCDDMEPINVAAAIKRDDPCKRVFIVSCGQNGSMASRVTNAGIDGLWSESQFLRRFSQVKRACASANSLQSKDDAAPCGIKDAFSLRGERLPAHHGVTDDRGPLPSGKPAGQQDVSRVKAEDTARSSSLSAVLPAASKPEQRVALRTKSATVIVVASGTGGCGKSTVSALCAALCAKAGLSTIAIDADLQFGDLHRLFGVKEPLRIEEALAEPNRMRKLGETARKEVALIAAPRRIEMSEEVAPGLASVIADASAMCDVVVVNTGAFWSDVQATAIEAADAVLFLMDCRPSSLKATMHAVELCARMGIATTSFTFAVNRFERSKLLSAVDVSCSLRGAHAVEIPEGGRDVDELLGSGYVEELLESRNPLVTAVGDVLRKLLPVERRDAMAGVGSASVRKRRSLFGRGGRK